MARFYKAVSAIHRPANKLRLGIINGPASETLKLSWREPLENARHSESPNNTRKLIVIKSNYQ
jgi:hypothetical protein